MFTPREGWVGQFEKSARRAGARRASLRTNQGKARRRRHRMSVMRFDPFRDFDRVVAEQMAGLRGAPRSVPMNAYRRGDQFLVHLDLPGGGPGGIELTVEQNVLTIKAERRFEPEEGDELVIAERP